MFANNVVVANDQLGWFALVGKILGRAAKADKSDDFVMVRAGTPGALSFAYKLEDERVYNAEFTGVVQDQFNVATHLVAGGDGAAAGLKRGDLILRGAKYVDKP